VSGRIEPLRVVGPQGLRRERYLRRRETFLKINGLLVSELGYGSVEKKDGEAAAVPVDGFGRVAFVGRVWGAKGCKPTAVQYLRQSHRNTEVWRNGAVRRQR
jgi:hypothetical protein